MNFFDRLKKISQELDFIERDCRSEIELNLIGKIQIFVQADLPGFISRLNSGDADLQSEVSMNYLLFKRSAQIKNRAPISAQKDLAGVIETIDDLYRDISNNSGDSIRAR